MESYSPLRVSNRGNDSYDKKTFRPVAFEGSTQLQLEADKATSFHSAGSKYRNL